MNRNDFFVNKLTELIGNLTIQVEDYLEPTRVREEIEKKLSMLSTAGILLFKETLTGEITVAFGLDVIEHLEGRGLDKMTAFLDLSKQMVKKGEEYASKAGIDLG